MLQKINHILNLIIGAFTGVFFGHCIYKYWHFHAYPKIYAMQSAPWYTGILLYGIVTLIIIILCLILKFIIKKKMKK